MSEPEVRIGPFVDQRQTVVLAVPGSAAEALEAVLGPGYAVVATASMLEDLPDLLSQHKPRILVISRYLPGAMDFVAALPVIRRASPATRIVVIMGAPDGDLGQIVQAGAMYGIFNLVLGDHEGNLNKKDLLAAVSTDRTWADIAPYMPDRIELPTVPTAAVPVRAAIDSPVVEPPVTKLSKVLVIGSGKGGVGKTSTAANIIACAAHIGVVGVDMDYTQSDLAARFFPEDRVNLNLRDLLQVLNLDGEVGHLTRQDVERVEDWVQGLPETSIPGASIIPGPSRDYSPARVPRALSAEILASAARRGRLVVVDTAFDIVDGATTDVLERADEILVVTTGEHSSIYETGWYLNKLIRGISIPAGKIRVVLNKVGLPGTRSAGEVADMLEHEVAFAVKYDKRYESAHLTRRPLALRDRKGPWSAYVESLVKPEATHGGRAKRPPHTSRRGLFSRRSA